MQSTKLFEDRVRDTLTEASEQVTASDLLKKRIYKEISNQKMKEGSSMKNIKAIKKIAIIAAAICCAMSVSVFAVGKITSYIGTSSKTDNYTVIPISKDLNNELGYVPKTVDSFSNGYKFESAHISNIKALDDSSNEVGKFKDMTFKYKCQNGQEIELVTDKIPVEEDSNNKESVTKYNNIDIKYFEQLYKFVPENYKLNDEEKADKASGKVVFSYGSDKVTVSTFKFTSWSDNGINYKIMAQDSGLSEADFVGMAKEVIDK